MTEAPIYVLNGPGLNVDQPGIQRWCEEWSRDLKASIVCTFANDVAAFDQSIREGATEGRGAVVSPGGPEAQAVAGQAVRESGLEVVWLDLNEAERPRPDYLSDKSVVAIRGRGAWGYQWAVRWLLQRLAWPFTVVPYGPERDQFGDLRLPEDGDGPFPTVVLVHGGFWRERWERDTIEPLAIDLSRRGYATWNLEYRRVGPYGGGWPNTCRDVAEGIDKLAELSNDYPLDLNRLIYIGHSAGGHLALWAVKRLGVEVLPRVKPTLVVSLAGVADLEEAAIRGLGDTGDGAADLMGGEPEERPDDYAAASPIRALPLGVPQLIVQGRLDNAPDLVDLSRLYVEAARVAGDKVDYLELDDADHFHLIVPEPPAWPSILERIEAFPR
jgi:acetyl esterase/lipase